MYNIILTDDHQVVREGMKFLLSTTSDINVVKDFDNGAETLKYLENNHDNINLVLTDLVMPEMDGIELTKLLKEKYKHIKVLVLSSYTSEEYIRPVFRAVQTAILLRRWKLMNSFSR